MVAYGLPICQSAESRGNHIFGDKSKNSPGLEKPGN
jgi:hypothetical protein